MFSLASCRLFEWLIDSNKYCATRACSFKAGMELKAPPQHLLEWYLSACGQRTENLVYQVCSQGGNLDWPPLTVKVSVTPWTPHCTWGDVWLYFNLLFLITEKVSAAAPPPSLHLALRVLVLSGSMTKAGKDGGDGLCVVQAARKHHLILFLCFPRKRNASHPQVMDIHVEQNRREKERESW